MANHIKLSGRVIIATVLCSTLNGQEAGRLTKTQGEGPDSGEVTDIAIDPRGSSDQIIYQVTVSAIVNGKRKNQTVGFDLARATSTRRL